MSARDKLRTCFPALPEGSSNDLIERAVDEILNDHAHELAEKIRAHADSPKVKPHLLEGEWTGLRMGANVIDPKKEGQ